MLRQLLLLFTIINWAFSSVAQSDTTKATQPFSLYFYWDYGKSMTLWTIFEQKWEGGMEARVYEKLSVVYENGSGNLTPKNAFKNVDYNVFGTYHRYGLGYIMNIDATSKLGLGMRYATANFQDQGVIFIQTPSDGSGTYVDRFRRENLTASWLEFVLTTEQSMRIAPKKPSSTLNERIILGSQFRYRTFMDFTDPKEVVEVYAIPGYGRSVNTGVLVINLFLKIKLI